jgi:hypothetical protein
MMKAFNINYCEAVSFVILATGDEGVTSPLRHDVKLMMRVAVLMPT